MAAKVVNDGGVKWRLINLMTSSSVNLLEAISQMASPIGSIVTFATDTNFPDGWVLCDGQELDRVEYVDLFETIGTKFGEGNGSTTFNIPNYLGKMLRGSGPEYTLSEANVVAAPTSEYIGDPYQIIEIEPVYYLIKARNTITLDGEKFHVFGGGTGVATLATHKADGLMGYKDKINLDTKFHQTNTVYSIGERVAIPGQPNYLMLECVKAGVTGPVSPDFGNNSLEYYKTNTTYKKGDMVLAPGQPTYLALECVNLNGGTTGDTIPNFDDYSYTTINYNYYQTNTIYHQGDIVRVPGQPSNLVLECINEGGTTGDTIPDF